MDSLDSPKTSRRSTHVFVLEGADPLCPDFRRNICALVASYVSNLLKFLFIYRIAFANLYSMIKFLPKVLCLGLLFVLSHKSIAQTTSLPSVFGKVIDASTGEPLKGADISVDFKKSGGSAAEFSNGKITFVIKVE